MANFTLTDRDLSVYDVETHSWKLVEGIFNFYIGSSSRDIRASYYGMTSTITEQSDVVIIQ